MPKNLTLEEFMPRLRARVDEYEQHVKQARPDPNDENWKQWEADWLEQFYDYDDCDA